MSVAEHGTEGGFGTGLRAKLQSGETPAEPRSPAEAIAAAAPVFEEAAPPATAPVDETEVEALRAELNASLAREQQLRSSLSDHVDTSARDAQVEQQLAEQSAALDRRAEALAETQAELDDRERRISDRLAELDGLLEEKEELTKLEARVAEREQLVEQKVHELKVGDDERSAAAVELKEKLAEIKKREKAIAGAEERVSAAAEETEARQAKLDARTRGPRGEGAGKGRAGARPREESRRARGAVGRDRA